MCGLFPGAKEEPFFIIELDELDGDHLAGGHLVVGSVGSPDLRRFQELLQLADAGLVLALLLFRSVVAAVFLEVAFFSRSLDSLGDLHPSWPLTLGQFLHQAVVGLLSQPRHIGHSRQL